MTMFEKFEQWAVRTYQPKVAPWKRPALLGTSVVFLAICAVASYFQIQHHWTNDGVWLVIGLFVFFGIYGVVISIWGSDLWVALSMGSPW